MISSCLHNNYGVVVCVPSMRLRSVCSVFTECMQFQFTPIIIHVDGRAKLMYVDFRCGQFASLCSM